MPPKRTNGRCLNQDIVDFLQGELDASSSRERAFSLTKVCVVVQQKRIPSIPPTSPVLQRPDARVHCHEYTHTFTTTTTTTYSHGPVYATKALSRTETSTCVCTYATTCMHPILPTHATHVCSGVAPRASVHHSHHHGDQDHHDRFLGEYCTGMKRLR